jgi:hypothetical protein
MKYILILIVLFSGCVTQKRCSERFPCVSGKDSIYIERLDTVEIILPGDSVIIETVVPCDDFELKIENGKLLASLKVVNGILQAKMNERPDTVFRFTTNTVTITKEIPTQVQVKYVPKFVKIMAFVGGVCVLLILFWLLMKFKVF